MIEAAEKRYEELAALNKKALECLEKAIKDLEDVVYGRQDKSA